jgi:hypothetical protein
MTLYLRTGDAGGGVPELGIAAFLTTSGRPLPC